MNRESSERSIFRAELTDTPAMTGHTSGMTPFSTLAVVSDASHSSTTSAGCTSMSYLSSSHLLCWYSSHCSFKGLTGTRDEPARSPDFPYRSYVDRRSGSRSTCVEGFALSDTVVLTCSVTVLVIPKHTRTSLSPTKDAAQTIHELAATIVCTLHRMLILRGLPSRPPANRPLGNSGADIDELASQGTQKQSCAPQIWQIKEARRVYLVVTLLDSPAAESALDRLPPCVRVPGHRHLHPQLPRPH